VPLDNRGDKCIVIILDVEIAGKIIIFTLKQGEKGVFNNLSPFYYSSLLILLSSSEHIIIIFH